MAEDQDQGIESARLRDGEISPPAVLADRRRPERPRRVSESLIPLLRFRPSPEQVETEQGAPAASRDAEEDDDLQAARGIAFGLAVSALLWVVLAVLLIWS